MINVVCVKHGTKYSPHYVNCLYNMVQRHMTLPYRFICFTEDLTNLNPGITIKLLPSSLDLQGWWWKLYLFKKGHFTAGETVLFFDLDMVIINNIDKFLTFMPGQFVGLEDVGRVYRAYPKKLGSAVMRWEANSYSDIWDNFEKSPGLIEKFRGDQDWIWSLHSNTIKFYPAMWIRSYKWEIRSQAELVRIGNKQVFKEVKTPIIDQETSVIAFHGTPNPEDVLDPVIVDNWC